MRVGEAIAALRDAGRLVPISKTEDGRSVYGIVLDPPRESGFAMEVQEEGQGSLIDVPSTSELKIEEVWAYFCEVNTPIQQDLTPSRRRMIERALREITVEEAKLAIDGNRASPWHRERKRHALGDVFKPNPQKRETIRQKVDRFIQDAQKAGRGLSKLDTIDRGKVRWTKEAVIAGFQAGADERARERAREAQKWLEANGITVILDGDWPRFVEVDE